jgi:vancomycin aglycone glucosyltransferase
MIKRALLSSVGTRGDVRPILALALSVRDLGHEVRLCVPPNFVDWVRGFGFEAVPVGVEMRHPVRSGSSSAAPLTAEQLRRLRESMPDLITDQFDAVGSAAEGCDVILGANAHQYAARSIAELRRVPYVTAIYAPVAIPSPDHAPPPAPGETWATGDAATNAQRWAWILEDSTPLAPEIEDFFARGEPPIYLGFGSMPAPEGVSHTLLSAARAVGRRAILSRGWAELGLIDEAPDCITVRDVSHQALFPRVAAVVHHGGAGTTASAARAGVPQVVVPMFGDQFYWASRVRALGIGSSVMGTLTTESLTTALREAIESAVADRSRSFARQLRADGAMVAARRLVNL